MSEYIKIPPIKKIGKALEKIIMAGKMLFDVFKNASKNGGKIESTSTDNAPETIEKVTEVFAEFKKQVHYKTEEIEKAIEQEVRVYLEEILDVLSDNQEITEKYGIKVKRIERKINRIIPQMLGIIDFELSKKISLDNNECRKIVKMIPGRKKEEALDEFLGKAFNESLDRCCENLQENLQELYEEVNEEILGTIEIIGKNCERQKEKLSDIDADNYIEKKNILIGESYYLICASEILERIMEE